MTLEFLTFGFLLYMLNLPASGNSQGIDRFIGNRADSPVKKFLGTFDSRDILTKAPRETGKDTPNGAVLTDIKALSFVTLNKGTSSEKTKLKGEQYIFYVVSGTGTIETSSSKAELYQGIGVLIPPGIDFHITNTGDETLEMYLLVEPTPPGFVPKRSIVVKYEYDNPVSTNVNRGSSDQWLFNIEDGLAVIAGINPVMFEPKSFVPPHAHPPGVEEIWLVIDGDIQVVIGNDSRNLPTGSAHRAPSDNKTPHATVNNSDVSKKTLWILKIPH